jgi:hypothetical protein
MTSRPPVGGTEEQVAQKPRVRHAGLPSRHVSPMKHAATNGGNSAAL